MKKLLSGFCFISLLGLYGFTSPFSFLGSNNNLDTSSSNWLNTETQIISQHAEGLNPNVLRLSLIAFLHARQQGLDNKELLTVIDYSKPSTEKRLWVFNLRSGRELFYTWVSHGRNSGGVLANSFSNSPGSLKSSLGVFLTDEPYFGHDGYSLRLRGLERGVNDNAYSRSIVIHGARYVNADIIRSYGQIGRSWGCPAVDASMSRSIINTIKENTLVFAYYPQQNWLSHSYYLNA